MGYDRVSFDFKTKSRNLASEIPTYQIYDAPARVIVLQITVSKILLDSGNQGYWSMTTYALRSKPLYESWWAHAVGLWRFCFPDFY